MSFCKLGFHRWIRSDHTRVIPVFTGDWIDREFVCGCGKIKWVSN